MNVVVDLDHVTDPEIAVTISKDGLTEQRATEARVNGLIRQLDALRRENHLSDRMANLLGARRFPS